jgi:hypothetical protein
MGVRRGIFCVQISSPRSRPGLDRGSSHDTTENSFAAAVHAAPMTRDDWTLAQYAYDAKGEYFVKQTRTTFETRGQDAWDWPIG